MLTGQRFMDFQLGKIRANRLKTSVTNSCSSAQSFSSALFIRYGRIGFDHGSVPASAMAANDHSDINSKYNDDDYDIDPFLR